MGVKLTFRKENHVVVNKYFPYLDLHIWLFGDLVIAFEMYNVLMEAGGTSTV